MIKLILSREYLPKETLGTYFVIDNRDVLFKCRVIELPWLNNQHNISCIPEGVYKVVKYSTEAHPESFWIKDVPGREGIMIHKGNFATGKKVDTEGCQCPGMYFRDINNDGNLDVVDSTEAMKTLNYYLPDEFKMIIC